MAMLSLVFLFSLPFLVTCQDDGKSKARQAAFSFPIPDSSESYNSVDSLNASWTSTYDDAFLRLWCKTSEKDQFGPTFGQRVPSTGSKSVLLNLQASGTCHFAINDRENGARALNSADFDVALNTSAVPLTYNVDGSVPTSDDSSSSSSSSTASSSPTAAAAVTSAPPPATTTNSESNTSASKGLTTGQGVGIGVGVAAGSVLLVTALILLFLRARQRRKERQEEIENEEGRKWIKEISTPRDFRRVDGWDYGGSGGGMGGGYGGAGGLRAEVPDSASTAVGSGSAGGSGGFHHARVQRQEAAGQEMSQELESPDDPSTQRGSTGTRSETGSGRERGKSESTLGIGTGTGTAVEPASELDSTPIK